MTLHRTPLATALIAALAIAPLAARANDDAAQAKRLGTVHVTANTD